MYFFKYSPFYTFLRLTLGASVRIFFRKIIVVGAENVPAGKPVILVSNHPSAFMDPLVLGNVSERELYFFARADIFSPGAGRWFMEKANISPIYRIVDGIDSLERNDAVFSHGYKLLSQNKILLLFGEGVTDEEFIRRVKTMKKGSMRIALGAEQKFDFKLGVNIVCVGINYSDPRKFQSDVVVSFSKPIEVNAYKESYLEHNNRAMFDLNKEIFSTLKQQLVHVENPEDAGLLEDILIITRKGINNEHHDPAISLTERWRYTQQLANAINNLSPEKKNEIRIKTSSYFQLTRSKNGKDRRGIPEAKTRYNPAELLHLLLGFPVFIWGFCGNYLPVKLSSYLSRKISRRPVFWSGTDLAFSLITVPVYYMVIAYFLNYLSILTLPYLVPVFLVTPLAGIFAFHYFKKSEKVLDEGWHSLPVQDKSNDIERAIQLKRHINEIADGIANQSGS